MFICKIKRAVCGTHRGFVTQCTEDVLFELEPGMALPQRCPVCFSRTKVEPGVEVLLPEQTEIREGTILEGYETLDLVDVEEQVAKALKKAYPRATVLSLSEESEKEDLSPLEYGVEIRFGAMVFTIKIQEKKRVDNV